MFDCIFGAGSLKLVTALEIASTPVKEEAPEEKAFNSKNNVTPVLQCQQLNAYVVARLL